jgi:preprotein translocase subunit SecA
MDRRTGEIKPLEEVRKLEPKEQEHFMEMRLSPTAYQRAMGRVGRNDPCPCNSGKKFKHCCYTGR